MNTEMHEALMEALMRRRKSASEAHLPLHELMASGVEPGDHGGSGEAHEGVPMDNESQMPHLSRPPERTASEENEHDGEEAPQGAVHQALNEMHGGNKNLRARGYELATKNQAASALKKK